MLTILFYDSTILITQNPQITYNIVLKIHFILASKEIELDD